jgi:hypothetical protein
VALSVADAHTQSTLPAHVPTDARLIEITAEGGVIGELVTVMFFSGLAAMMLHLPWWLAVVPAALLAAYRRLAEVLRNRILEPVVRFSQAAIGPGDAVTLECELRAKTVASVQHVVIGLESRETYGEDSHTETYGVWAVDFPDGPIGRAPVSARHTLQAPRFVQRKWSTSDLKWHVTLHVEVEDGMTVKRSYALSAS